MERGLFAAVEGLLRHSDQRPITAIAAKRELKFLEV